MGTATSNGNEAKSNMKHPPDIAKPGSEPRCFMLYYRVVYICVLEGLRKLLNSINN